LLERKTKEGIDEERRTEKEVVKNTIHLFSFYALTCSKGQFTFFFSGC